MIVADEVQKTMHDKMGEMMSERLALGTGLPRDGLVGQDDVAEMRRLVRGLLARKRQHVGGGVDAAPKPVELTERRTIDRALPGSCQRSESTSTSILSFARAAGVIPAARARACALRLRHKPRRCARRAHGGSRRR